MRALRTLLMSAALVLALTACSDDEPQSPPDAPDGPPPPEAFDAPAPGGAPGHPSQVGSGGGLGG